MDTADLTVAYRATGPFATVLTDVGHDAEDGRHAHELRVRAARDQLASQGADESVVEAVTERLTETVAAPAPLARAVVATPSDGVVYDDLAGVRLDSTTASWGPLPDLGPWLAHRESAASFVLALVDHVGGDVAVHRASLGEPDLETSVDGETEHVHKVPVGGWASPRYQRTSENVWRENAEAVVDEITTHVRAGHRLVLLAGDPTSVGLVGDRLDDLALANVVRLPTGTRADDGGDEALEQAVREALTEHVAGRRLALVHELKDRMGRGQGVATGVDDVADALVRGQVETLLIDPPEAAEHQLDPARHPGLALSGTPAPAEPVPADQALVAAAVLTSADVAVSPEGALGGAPVAALLRWSQEAVGSEQT